MTQVDFYVSEASDDLARLRLACRIVEKAYLAGHSVFVWCPDAEVLARFDDLLWTFADRSFVPHGRAGVAAAEVPVLLSAAAAPSGALDVIVNLDVGVPAFASDAARIAEIIDGNDARRQAGRARFRAYRELGLTPVTHAIRAD